MKISQIFIICLILFKIKNSSISNCDYYFYYFANYCKECDDGYKLKEEDGTCTACDNGKVGYDNYCFNKIENCEEYELYAEGEICEECKIGYALSEDLSKCNKCKDGEISDGYSCFKVIEHCDDYSSDYTCLKCDDDYYLQDNKCSKCENNQRSDGKICYEKIDNCDDYSSSRYYEGNSYKYCYQCNFGDKPYLTTGGTQCNNCGTGKYSLNGKCIDEIEYCMEYSSETKCSRCIIGFKITSDGKCVPCLSPYMSQNDGKTCYLPHLYCYEYDNEGNCIYCYKGYKLNSSKKCIKTNAGGINIHNSFYFKINIRFRN